MDYNKRMDRIENKITAAGGVKFVWLDCYDADGNYIEPPPPEPGEIRVDLSLGNASAAHHHPGAARRLLNGR